jgi:hypothetical protein
MLEILIYKHMYQIIQDDLIGIIKVSESFSPTASYGTYFTQSGQEYTQHIYDLNNVLKFKSFTYSTSGASDNRYLTTQYRISRDGSSFTYWQDLNQNITNFPPFNPADKMFVEVKFTRSGSSNVGDLRLLDYSLDGLTDRIIIEDSSASTLSPGKTQAVIKPPFVYKVFKISDLEVITRGDSSNLNIKYRFSQDYGRTVTQWEPLTKENISTVRITPIRFFQIEYLLEYTGSTNVNIYDINLIGDFQNVTMDGAKTNLYGVRENCTCLRLGIHEGVFTGDTTSTDGSESSTPSEGNQLLNGASCDTPNALYKLNDEDKSKLFKPYQQTQAVNFLNKVSNDANEMFGHEVVYFLTDPDKKGIDYTFHEYQLLNYVCEELIKVSVENNQFPENTGAINQFDLSLFDSFEIHIPKDSFKTSFGVEKRPSKEDFLWFCEINKMFQVEHVAQYRGFNNNSIYWKIMLKKYSQKANVIAGNPTIADKVKELTKNSTIDELFGIENTQDKKAVANKEQFMPLTHDSLRVDIIAKVNKELIENSTNIISKTNYDFSDMTFGDPGVTYRNMKSNYKVSDNIGFYAWFNIYNYVVNDVYNLFNYFDDNANLGFRMDVEADMAKIRINNETYEMPLGATGSSTADGLSESTWYCYVVNVDQRQRSVSQWIYKRNVNYERDAANLPNTILKNVYKLEQSMVPQEFDLESTVANILASDMKITNIRLFEGVIPEVEHNKILNMAILREDTKYLVFADNANTRLTLPKYPLS